MDYPIRITNLDLIQDQNDGLFRLLFNSRNVINNKGDRENYKSLGVHFELEETGYGSYIFKSSGTGTKALMDDAQYYEVPKEAPSDGKVYARKNKTWIETAGDYELPVASSTVLGGIKTGYTTSGKNYPVQLDSNNKAYVNVPWTDTNTTYSVATTSANGLMSSTDKTKMDRLRSYTTATTVASLNVNYESIYVTLSANASLSVSGIGTTYNGRTITAFVYTSAARTITIPTSGSYLSMCGSSYTTKAGKWVEFNLTCIAGIWHIAKLEQD